MQAMDLQGIVAYDVGLLRVDVGCSHPRNRGYSRNVSLPGKKCNTIFEILLAWAGWPLASTANLPKSNLVGAYPVTWLSLLESHVWGLGMWFLCLCLF
jgi:hypothetical protein